MIEKKKSTNCACGDQCNCHKSSASCGCAKIFGIGTDILEIGRFRDAMHKYGQNFLDKLFSQQEQDHCHAYAEPERRFAARFAAKEAVVKALGEGFGKHIKFLDIEILNSESGKPEVHLSKKCNDHFGSPTLFLTISHSRDYATATVLATKS